MKTSLLLAFTIAALAAGCGKSSESTPTGAGQSKAGDSLVTAPVDYLSTVAKAQQSAVKSVDTVAINQALQMFNVSEGRFPKDLSELVAKKYIPQLPPAPANMKFAYDATNGTVKIVPK